MPVGTAYTVKMRVLDTAKTPDAYVRFQKEGKAWQTEPMQIRDEDGKKVYFAKEAFSNLQVGDSFKYCFVVREGYYLTESETVSPEYQVTVLPRPKVSEGVYRIIYPKGMNLPNREGSLVSGETIAVLQDAALEVDMNVFYHETAEQVAGGTHVPPYFRLDYTPIIKDESGVKLGATTPQDLSVVPGSTNMYRFDKLAGQTLKVAEKFQIEPYLRDQNDYDNRYPGCTALYTFEPKGDAPPTLDLLPYYNGVTPLTVGVDNLPGLPQEAKVTITLTATDDYGIKATRLKVIRERPGQRRRQGEG